MRVYLASFDDNDGYHIIVIRADSPEDAVYCTQEGYDHIRNLHIVLVKDPRRFADVPDGIMIEL